MTGFARTLLARLFSPLDPLPLDVKPDDRVVVHLGEQHYMPGTVVYWVKFQQLHHDDRGNVTGKTRERRVLVALDDGTYYVAHPVSLRTGREGTE